MNQGIVLDNFTPAADIVVCSVCLVMIVLVAFSYISRTRSSVLFLSMVGLVLAAAWTDITFYTVALMTDYQLVANWLRCAYHAMLLLIFVHYVAYICEIIHLEKQQLYTILANVIFAVVLLADIIITAQGPTYTITETSIVFNGNGIFFGAYLAFGILCIILMTKARKFLFRRVMFGFYGTMIISLSVLLIQGLTGQSSFTVASLLLPVIAMMYVLHSNPYDVMLGTNDVKVMRDLVKYYYDNKKDFVFVSLYMRAFDEEGKELPEGIQAAMRQLTYQYFKRIRLFKVSKGHIVVLFPKKQNRNYEEKFQQILDAFYALYEQYRYDFKIVIGDAVDEVSRKADYVNYIKSVHRTMPECSVHRIDAEDVTTFNQSEYILKELADIYHKRDLDDARVLAYCQPVLNVRTGEYDTAEALMRLNLQETGIVYPDKFIPLAEEQGYIHVLTEIILHKTCKAIKHFTEAGYKIRRISINVSAQELKDTSFCHDIMSIIDGCGVSGEKIAIELTESRNESDFMLMKEKIEELKQNGIKFYLDDFGTGYSNMERIMELPFDIIKFDRSLLLASGADERSKRMVSNLANMFSDMNYYVLYEGVEKDSDEDMCKSMSATYLQGFKYSKPTPIIDLKEYIRRKAG